MMLTGSGQSKVFQKLNQSYGNTRQKRGECLSDSATISRSLSAGTVLIEQVTGLYFSNEVNQDPGKWVQTLLSGLGYTHGVWYQTSAVTLAKLLWQIVMHRLFISIPCY